MLFLVGGKSKEEGKEEKIPQLWDGEDMSCFSEIWNIMLMLFLSGSKYCTVFYFVITPIAVFIVSEKIKAVFIPSEALLESP